MEVPEGSCVRIIFSSSDRLLPSPVAVRKGGVGGSGGGGGVGGVQS